MEDDNIYNRITRAQTYELRSILASLLLESHSSPCHATVSLKFKQN
jgi:hypothetical protein